MARGGHNSWAVTEDLSARGLLYGRRLSGTGPDITRSRRPSDWEQLQQDLITHLRAVDYISEGNDYLYFDDQGPCRRLLFEVADPQDDSQVTRIMTIDEQGRRGVCLFNRKRKDSSGWTRHQLIAGSQPINDLDMLEEYFYDSSDELGIDYVERVFDWRDLSRRLARGERYELAVNHFDQVNNSEAIADYLDRLIAKQRRRRLRIRGDLDDLRSKLNQLDGHDITTYLELLASHHAGITILEDAGPWRVRRLSNDSLRG